MPSNQVLNQIWHLLLVVPLTNHLLKWTHEAREALKRSGWCLGLLRRAEPAQLHQAAPGRCCGSGLTAAGLVRYWSLGLADSNRTKKRVCLVMETTSAMWSLYGFSLSWPLTKKQTTASAAEKEVSSVARTLPEVCSQCCPLIFSANVFGNFN